MPTGAKPKPSAGSPDWEAPTERMEWTFEGDVQAAPEWIDRGWAGFDRGPALHIPAGDLWGNGPYTTKTARSGDTIVFVPAQGAKVAHFEVLQGEQTVEKGGTVLPAQASQASLEDMVKLGHLAPDSMGAEAKGQVAVRTPSLAKVMSGEAKPPAEAQPVAVSASPTPGA